MKQGSPATEWGGAGGKNAGTEARCPFFPSLPFTHGYWAPVCARATQSAGDTSLSRADIPAALMELTLQRQRDTKSDEVSTVYQNMGSASKRNESRVWA